MGINGNKLLVQSKCHANMQFHVKCNDHYITLSGHSKLGIILDAGGVDID